MRFRPLHNQWLFRFECKNNSFKNFKIHNFINLPFSLAKYHQISYCYSTIGSDGERSDNYLYQGDIVKEGTSGNFSEMYPHLAQEFVDRISQNIDYRVYETNEVIIHGLKYRPRACLLTGWDNT